MKFLVGVFQKLLQSAICIYDMMQLFVPDAKAVQMFMNPVIKGKQFLIRLNDRKIFRDRVRKQTKVPGADQKGSRLNVRVLQQKL